VVAPVIGPTLGGWISDNYSWHWVFLINVPMGLLSLFLVGTLVSEPSGAEQERRQLLSNGLRVDYVGFALVAVGLGSLEFVLDEGQRNDWFGSNVIVAFALTACFCLVAVVIWELNHDEPIIDIRLLGQRQFGACFLAMLGTGAIVIATTQILAAVSADRNGLHSHPCRTGAVAGRTRNHGDDADHRLVYRIGTAEIPDRGGLGDRGTFDVAPHRNHRRHFLRLRRNVAHLPGDRAAAVVSPDHDRVL
jgi:MFS family permease